MRWLKGLYNNMVSPPSALDIATRPVYSCNMKDKIHDTIRVMKENIYTHVPVYKEDKFFGMLTESAVTYWLASQADETGGGFITTENTIAGMKDFIKNDANNEVLFVERGKSVFEVEEKFFDYIEQGKRLGAVFVTETGKQSEKLLGIITAWDLPKIKRFQKDLS
jgi:predicted transcriptional regulator